MKRLVVVGGAGSLEVVPGIQLVDTPDFPEALKALALAHCEALEVYRSAEHLEWTYVSPALMRSKRLVSCASASLWPTSRATTRRNSTTRVGGEIG